MNQHTPGPWKIEKHNFAEIYAESILVADVLIGKDSADGCGAANARLIAKAPEMVEILGVLAAINPKPTHPLYRRIMDARALLREIEED